MVGEVEEMAAAEWAAASEVCLVVVWSVEEKAVDLGAVGSAEAMTGVASEGEKAAATVEDRLVEAGWEAVGSEGVGLGEVGLAEVTSEEATGVMMAASWAVE